MKVRRGLLLAALTLTAVGGWLIDKQARAQTPAPAPAEAPAQAPDYQYFFTATDQSFEAYMEKDGTAHDADGNRLVGVKLTKFSDSFRKWIKDNFPDGETAEYALDSYSIDCAAKQVGEHRIVWYDSTGSELTDYDFGGHMTTPVAYSMKDNLMKKVCGIR